MPTRVVDLGTATDESRPLAHTAPIRLVESIPISVGRRYACLSHRWGPAQHMNITTEATYASNCSGIAFADLGLAYKDAVLIARRLGIRYLWIDSLCVLQDSRADWDAESKLMARVYSGGVLTIALNGEARSSVTRIESPSHRLYSASSSPPVYAQVQLPHLWSGEEKSRLLSRGW